MIVVAIIALLAAIAVPGLLRARLNSANNKALAVLKTTATAFENYLAAEGGYPASVDVLASATPPYLSDNFFDGVQHDGYIYSVNSITETAYSLSAVPNSCGSTGTENIAIATGAVVTSVEC